MSRYEKIDTDIIEMKELIIAVNKRFDQLYKKIDGIEDRLEVIEKAVKDNKKIKSDLAAIKAHFGIK